ncbi:MAG: ribonuclease III [Chloroflexi bacterium]|nr:ribonuclease III [Chloroflexota bacterium]
MFDSKRLEQVLGVEFRDPSLLQQALVHDSYLNENPGFALPSNERLEFLGDAVLGYIIAERLFHLFPDLLEGKLTAFRAYLVQQDTLHRVARSLDMGRYLLLGVGEAKGGGRDRPSNLARALEAVIGAVAVDQGTDAARTLVLRLLESELAQLKAGKQPFDYKSRLQEVLQSKGQPAPSYHLVDATGAAHARWFTVEARQGDKVLGKGEGNSKRVAETEAARAALEGLEEL